MTQPLVQRSRETASENQARGSKWKPRPKRSQRACPHREPRNELEINAFRRRIPACSKETPSVVSEGLIVKAVRGGKKAVVRQVGKAGIAMLGTCSTPGAEISPPVPADMMELDSIMFRLGGKPVTSGGEGQGRRPSSESANSQDVQGYVEIPRHKDHSITGRGIPGGTRSQGSRSTSEPEDDFDNGNRIPRRTGPHIK